MSGTVWAKLCIHAIFRGVISGNVFTQPSFAYQQAYHYINSTAIHDVKPFVHNAFWQIGAFTSAGLISRACICFYPHAARPLMHLGICIWWFGIALLIGIGEGITYDQFFGISVSFIDMGGGVYFWSSLDNLIFLTTEFVIEHNLIRAIFGCFSYAYVFGTYWIFRDMSRFDAGFLKVYPILFAIASPLIVLLFHLEWKCIRNPKPPIRPKPSLFSASLYVHFVFILVFSLFIHLPSIVLFFHHKFTRAQNERLLYSNIFGMVLGETIAATVGSYWSLYVFTSIALPWILLEWMYNYFNFEFVANLLVFFGFCSGALQVWIFQRIVEQWLKSKDDADLRALLFLMTLLATPGSLILPRILSAMEDVHGIIHHEVVLNVSFWLAIVSTMCVILHNIVFIKDKN